MTVAAAAGQGLSVVVASRNAVKINAVAAALRAALPGGQHKVTAADSISGVKDQPWGDAETLQGARNRAVSIQALHPRSVLVAIEGGVGPATPLPPPTLQPGQQRGAAGPAAGCQVLECFAWVVVQAPCGATAHARSASFPLPPAVSRLMLEEELELGAADDRVFKRTKSGQGSGTIGQLTHGVLTRTLYYEHAALCALVPLLNPSLYPGWDLAALPAGEQ